MNDVFENIIRVSKFRHLKEIETLGKENDLKRWLMTPGTVNAFYTRTGESSSRINSRSNLGFI